jgi:hypothetical protein
MFVERKKMYMVEKFVLMDILCVKMKGVITQMALTDAL